MLKEGRASEHAVAQAVEVEAAARDGIKGEWGILWGAHRVGECEVRVSLDRVEGTTRSQYMYWYVPLTTETFMLTLSGSAPT